MFIPTLSAAATSSRELEIFSLLGLQLWIADRRDRINVVIRCGRIMFVVHPRVQQLKGDGEGT
jgi:hypothetical protein